MKIKSKAYNFRLKKKKLPQRNVIIIVCVFQGISGSKGEVTILVINKFCCYWESQTESAVSSPAKPSELLYPSPTP